MLYFEYQSYFSLCETSLRKGWSGHIDKGSIHYKQRIKKATNGMATGHNILEKSMLV
jgi:hypothetical protein